jgi:hypothetical protein
MFMIFTSCHLTTQAVDSVEKKDKSVPPDITIKHTHVYHVRTISNSISLRVERDEIEQCAVVRSIAHVKAGVERRNEDRQRLR